MAIGTEYGDSDWTVRLAHEYKAPLVPPMRFSTTPAIARMSDMTFSPFIFFLSRAPSTPVGDESDLEANDEVV